MVIPNSFNPSDVITAAGHNQNNTDIANEISNSLALDGQSVMTGQIKGANGTAAAPSVTFGSDVDTGLFRKGANSLGIAVGGAEVGYIDSGGLHTMPVLGMGSVFIGAVSACALPSATPAGWLACGGQAVSRTTYALLFAAIGTAFGAGDGSTTFNVPDIKGRVIAGLEDSATRLTAAGSGINGSTFAAAGGAESVTLSTAQIPAHTHTATSLVTDPGHVHNIPLWDNESATGNVTEGAGSNLRSINTNSATTGISVATTNANAGGGGAHSSTQPTIVMRYLIFAGA